MCRTFLYSFCIQFYSENLKILRNLVYWPWGKLFGSRKTLSEAACSEQLPISKPIIFWESFGKDWTTVKFSAKSISYDSHYSGSTYSRISLESAREVVRTMISLTVALQRHQRIFLKSTDWNSMNIEFLHNVIITFPGK